jgi:hypothetical protein
MPDEACAQHVESAAGRQLKLRWALDAVQRAVEEQR